MKRFKRVVLTVVGFYFIISIMLYFLQEKLLFFPTKLPHEYQYKFDEPFEEIFQESLDGARLNALHFKVPESKGVILYFHGNAGDLSRWGEIATYFLQFQYDVVIMDYRTYGKSTGKKSEKALYADAQLFYDYVKSTFSEEDIVIYGRSLGTTFATYVASQNNPGQLILETPFYSLTDVAIQYYPFLPVKYLLKYKFATCNFVPYLNCGTTIIHGTADSVVPYNSGEKLFGTMEPQRSRLVTIEGGNHNNLIEFETYHETIKTVLK